MKLADTVLGSAPVSATWRRLRYGLRVLAYHGVPDPSAFVEAPRGTVGATDGWVAVDDEGIAGSCVACQSIHWYALTPGQRVDLIRSNAAWLAEVGLREIDLVLNAFGLPTGRLADDRYACALAMHEQANDDDLLELDQYHRGAPDPVPTDTPHLAAWEADRFRLFLARLTAEQSHRRMIHLYERLLVS